MLTDVGRCWPSAACLVMHSPEAPHPKNVSPPDKSSKPLISDQDFSKNARISHKRVSKYHLTRLTANKGIGEQHNVSCTYVSLMQSLRTGGLEEHRRHVWVVALVPRFHNCTTFGMGRRRSIHKSNGPHVKHATAQAIRFCYNFIINNGVCEY